MAVIDQDLCQFSSYLQQINLTFHQYLLLGDEPLLVHTGNVIQAEALLPQLKAALDGKDLIKGCLKKFKTSFYFALKSYIFT
jgi:hypothetical protein